MKRSEYKMRIREEALRKVKGPSGGITGSREFRERIEQTRHQMLHRAKWGGDPKVSQVKSELNYLLNNYLPVYDQRILMLIEEWRRTGDPSYSPEVRVRLRKAREEHRRKAQPL